MSEQTVAVDFAALMEPGDTHAPEVQGSPLEVAIAGSGDVSVAEASGPVSRSVVGSGTVSIGR